MKSVLIIYQRFFSSVSLKWVIAKLLALFLRQTAFWHFPGGPLLKNLPASGDMGSIPGLGGSHMLQSNKAHAAQLLNQVPQCPCSTREAATMRSALTTTSESPRAAVKMPCSQKKRAKYFLILKIINFLKFKKYRWHSIKTLRIQLTIMNLLFKLTKCCVNAYLPGPHNNPVVWVYQPVS